MCRGMARQKAYDESNQVCSMPLSVNNLHELTKGDMRDTINGELLESAKDVFHEDDGGQDEIGTMRQDGRSILEIFARA